MCANKSQRNAGCVQTSGYWNNSSNSCPIHESWLGARGHEHVLTWITLPGPHSILRKPTPLLSAFYSRENWGLLNPSTCQTSWGAGIWISTDWMKSGPKLLHTRLHSVLGLWWLCFPQKVGDTILKIMLYFQMCKWNSICGFHEYVCSLCQWSNFSLWTYRQGLLGGSHLPVSQ